MKGARGILALLCMLAAAPAVAGTVYRCDSADGSRSYVSKRVAGTSAQYLYLEFLSSTYGRLAAYRVDTNATGTYASSAVSHIAPAGTKYVRVFAYGPSSAGTRSSFEFDSMKLLAQ